MKGLVFTEFLDFVQDEMGADMADTIIDDCAFDHGGAYTAVGNYDYREMVALVGALSRHAATPVPDLLQVFGAHLICQLRGKFPNFFDGRPDTLSFLETVEERIHFEVRKLYPDAELPRFETERLAPDTLKMHYHSCRPFAQLAVGMMNGAANIFGERLDITEDVRSNDGQTVVEFTIKLMQQSDGKPDRSAA